MKTDAAEVFITSSPIGAADAEMPSESRDGAVVTFLGIVRGESEGKPVTLLEYEAYDAMAEQETLKIARDALEKWPVHRIRIIHRTGKLGVGDVSVVVSVAAAHRGPAFEACEYCIDTLKEKVPIWKKEMFEDGSGYWVGHP